MANTIQVELAEISCKAGVGYAQKHLTTPPKDAIICCEGMCLKGETARRAANLIAHKLVPDRAVRICHGGLLEEAGGMRELVKRAKRVLVLDGCGMACGTRLTKGAFPDLEPRVVFTNELFECDQEIFGVEDMPDSQISADSRKVADQIVQKFF
ncbi:MAG TPA: putative zinc-binding protein [Syntrophobacteraceae bacterium]|nr:putative zinc-binding protein [Syntrophobacteraceae bacterium]